MSRRKIGRGERREVGRGLEGRKDGTWHFGYGSEETETQVFGLDVKLARGGQASSVVEWEKKK